MKNRRLFLIIASVFGCTGVALGAFGAHGLRDILSPEYRQTFETAVRYQMYHTFALIASALLSAPGSDIRIQYAGWCFIAGTILFSGSLYVLTASGIAFFGAITPFGGICFLAGWFFLFRSAWTIKKEN